MSRPSAKYNHDYRRIKLCVNCVVYIIMAIGDRMLTLCCSRPPGYSVQRPRIMV